jgi:hypothetical protein
MPKPFLIFFCAVRPRGRRGSARCGAQAADIILLDDNFASIVGAIEEGRTLFDNLKKTIAYTLTHLWPELVPVFLNLAFSFPLAMNGLFILTIDLLTEQGPAISLAFEQPEALVMERKPRNVRTDRLVNFPSLFYAYIIAGLPNAAVSMWAFFMVFVSYGLSVNTVYNSVPRYFQVPSKTGAYGSDPITGGFAWPLVGCGDSGIISGTRRDDISALFQVRRGAAGGGGGSVTAAVDSSLLLLAVLTPGAGPASGR